MLNLVLMPSVPGLAIDMAGAVLDTILIELSRFGDIGRSNRNGIHFRKQNHRPFLPVA